jgi:hypothetical protein
MRASAGERTALAWQRSALGPLASTALLLSKQLGPAPGRVLLAAANVLLALGVTLRLLIANESRSPGGPPVVMLQGLETPLLHKRLDAPQRGKST